MQKKPNVTITVNDVPLEDLQAAKDIHLEGRTFHHLKKPVPKGGERRGRKGTGKTKVYSSQTIDLGDEEQLVKIKVSIEGNKVIQTIEVIDK